MKIMTIHNKYKIRGGEDVSRESEDEILRENGHTVVEVIFDNKEIDNGITAAAVGVSSIWNQRSYRRAIDQIEIHRPDIVDIHNFFPRASPAVHYAAKQKRIPVVQTLHNFRLLCLNGLFFRDGSVCTDCLGTSTMRGVKHACYRDSVMASASVSSMVQAHRILRTWEKKVDAFVTLTEFSKKIFEGGGLSSEKLYVKPNFVEDMGFISSHKGYYIYIGRLTEEKGVRNLLKVWESLPDTFKIKIIGEGPLLPELSHLYSNHTNITFTGKLNKIEMNEYLGHAKALIFPSEWYETFGRVVIEAFSRGVPVIASDIGGISYIVNEGLNGFLFESGSKDSLRRVILARDYELSESSNIRNNARERYLKNYTPEVNYDQMMYIYAKAQENNEKRT